MTASTAPIPADHPVERSADLFLSAPASQALLAIIEASDLGPADLADPELASLVASLVMDNISPWSGTTPAVLERLAIEAPARRPLAEQLAAAPELDGWFAPLDRSRPQLWSSYASLTEPADRSFDRATSGPMDPWEGYAHKPEPTVLTSTPFGDDLSSLVLATALGANDLHPYDNAPVRRRKLSIRDDARVYEITGPRAWAELARAYPYLSFKGHHAEEGPDGIGYYPDQPTLVPDWPAVARDWDGIHLSLGAMLLSTEVPISDAAGRSALWAWDAEGTYWLRWVFDDEVVLPEIGLQALQDRQSKAQADRIQWPMTLWHHALMDGDGAEARKLRAQYDRLVEARKGLSKPTSRFRHRNPGRLP